MPYHLYIYIYSHSIIGSTLISLELVLHAIVCLLQFHQQIHCVIPQPEGNEPLIMFSNGAVYPLSTAVENRKREIDSSLLGANEVIEDYHVVTYETFTFVTLFYRNCSVCFITNLTYKILE
jgi:hypothetical protein